MSCGDHHDTDCSEVLAEVWLFLDQECDQGRRALLPSTSTSAPRASASTASTRS